MRTKFYHIVRHTVFAVICGFDFWILFNLYSHFLPFPISFCIPFIINGLRLCEYLRSTNLKKFKQIEAFVVGLIIPLMIDSIFNSTLDLVLWYELLFGFLMIKVSEYFLERQKKKQHEENPVVKKSALAEILSSVKSIFW